MSTETPDIVRTDLAVGSILIEEITRTSPNGRKYLELTPIFRPDTSATGELKFASWQVWEDESSSHNEARLQAMASARRALIEFARCIDAASLESLQ